MKTLKKLFAAFDKAQKREAETLERYTQAMRGIYVKANCYDPNSEMVELYTACVSATYGLMHYAEEEFGGRRFSRGKNGRFYEKPKAEYKLRSLEHDYKVAEKNLNAFLTVFAAAGIDPNDKALWN